MIVRQEHRTVLRLPFDPTTTAVTRHLPPRIEGTSAPGVGARVGRTTHETAQRLPMRSMPVQLSPVRAGRHAVRHLDVMLPQITQQAAEAAQDCELVQDQANDALRLLVGIELQFAVRADHVAGRDLAEPFAAAGAIQAAGLHPLLDLMQLDPSHESLDGQDEAIVEIDADGTSHPGRPARYQRRHRP